MSKPPVHRSGLQSLSIHIPQPSFIPQSLNRYFHLWHNQSLLDQSLFLVILIIINYDQNNKNKALTKKWMIMRKMEISLQWRWDELATGSGSTSGSASFEAILFANFFGNMQCTRDYWNLMSLVFSINRFLGWPKEKEKGSAQEAVDYTKMEISLVTCVLHQNILPTLLLPLSYW